ncbi:hypothetical protein [Brevundimonas sp.]|uniref:hypothetical protein n=1 Tax=Brevundimonas sp. TaxID=1871086 RepID=UPI00248A25AE|nr:hypothetical protein [Brevundimonas sp.]MDI1280165.1 hypothetical protein [Brevundimonas sp.]
MTPEQKMNALFAADAAPARDLGFQADVARRIARQRAWATVVALVPWLIAATAVLWGLQPALAAAADQLAPTLIPVAMTLTLVVGSLAAALWLTRRLGRA